MCSGGCKIGVYIYMMILYMHTFLLHTLCTQVRKFILLLFQVSGMLSYIFKIYGLDKKVF